MRTKNCNRDDVVLGFFCIVEDEGGESLITSCGERWRSSVASSMNCLWKATTVRVLKGDDIDVNPHRREGRGNEE